MKEREKICRNKNRSGGQSAASPVYITLHDGFAAEWTRAWAGVMFVFGGGIDFTAFAANSGSSEPRDKSRTSSFPTTVPMLALVCRGAGTSFPAECGPDAHKKSLSLSGIGLLFSLRTPHIVQMSSRMRPTEAFGAMYKKKGAELNSGAKKTRAMIESSVRFPSAVRAVLRNCDTSTLPVGTRLSVVVTFTAAGGGVFAAQR